MYSVKALSVPTRNRILNALPREEYEHLLPNLERVHLPKGKTLCHAGDIIHSAYFITGGMVSLLSTTEDGDIVEVAMVGSEGMTGVPLVLKVDTAPYQIMVQIKADAMKIKASALKAEFNRGGQLQSLLLRYTHSVLCHVAQSAVCNRFHTLEERLCRWLMISRSVMHSDTIFLTQEFISHMLGAPRTGVTMIAGNLQRKKLISYTRGKIQILDPRALESNSCGCYRAVREEIDHFLAA